jgi:ArsR family transcriptional regulator, arsenate/arsenite/antimonite-responsive transcriptional repressor
MTTHVLPTSSTRFAPTLSEDKAKKQARILKALADPTRLRILNLLHRYEGNMSVFDITEVFDLEQPTISFHLKVLTNAGLVDSRKQGLWAYYYLIPERLQEAQRLIAEVCK